MYREVVGGGKGGDRKVIKNMGNDLNVTFVELKHLKVEGYGGKLIQETYTEVSIGLLVYSSGPFTQ